MLTPKKGPVEELRLLYSLLFIEQHKWHATKPDTPDSKGSIG